MGGARGTGQAGASLGGANVSMRVLWRDDGGAASI